MTVALPFMKSYAGILVFSVFYGVGDGVFVTTMNSLLMFTLDEKDRAAAVGLGSSLLSIGIAGGPPLAGKHLLLSRTGLCQRTHEIYEAGKRHIFKGLSILTEEITGND